MIRPTGIISSRLAIRNSCQRVMPSRFWKNHASISGIAIFMISDGWITMPRSIQRREPFLTRPNRATATSRAIPSVYTGTARRISVCGGMLAAIHNTTNAIRMLRRWSSIRPGKSMPAEYMVTIPVARIRKMISASGPSNTFRNGLTLCQGWRFSSMGRDIGHD